MSHSAAKRSDALLRPVLLAAALVTPGVFGYLTTYILLVILLAMSGQAGWSAFRKGRAGHIDLPSRLFLLAFAVLAIDIAVNAFVAGDPADIRYALNFGMFLFYAPLAASLERGAGPSNAARVADLSLLGVLACAAVAVFESLVLDAPRAGYLAGDPIRLGNTALILGALSLIGFDQRSGARRWLYLAGPALAAIVIVLAGARSALVALPIVLIVGVLVLIPRRRIALAVLAAGAAMAGVGVGVLAALRNERVLSLFEMAGSLATGAPLADEAMEQRLTLYRAGLSAFAESPWLGSGWHDRMEAMARHLPPGQGALAGMPHLHNEALNFAVGAGLVGVAAFLLVLAIPLVGAWRSPRDGQYRVRLFGCVVLVASYAVLGLVDVMVSYELHTALFVVITAIMLSYCRDVPDRGRQRETT